MQLFITHFMSSEELISTDQSVQMYYTVFGFCQTLILSFFLNSVTFDVILGIKCHQLKEFDAS